MKISLLLFLAITACTKNQYTNSYYLQNTTVIQSECRNNGCCRLILDIEGEEGYSHLYGGSIPKGKYSYIMLSYMTDDLDNKSQCYSSYEE